MSNVQKGPCESNKWSDQLHARGEALHLGQPERDNDKLGLGALVPIVANYFALASLFHGGKAGYTRRLQYNAHIYCLINQLGKCFRKPTMINL